MVSKCLVLPLMAAVLINLLSITPVLSYGNGGGGLVVIGGRGSKNKVHARWETTCRPGVKYIIKCSKCDCSSNETPVNCEETRCPTERFGMYDARKRPVDSLGCNRYDNPTICEECYCFHPYQPGQMCLRMGCPPLKN